MDQPTREIFCNLTWPTTEDILDSSDAPPRRPSPFWLKEKLTNNRNRLSHGYGNSQNASVTRRWKAINQFVDLRLLLNLDTFNYNRSRIFLQCKEYKFLDLTKFDYGSFLVESVSNGLLLKSETCRITSVLTVMHPSDMPKSEILETVKRHFRGYGVITSQTAMQDTKTRSERNYRRIFLQNGKIKHSYAAVLNELILDPMKHLNAIALDAKLKRSTTKKAYVDLVKGAMFYLDPFIRSEDYRDFVVARLHFRISKNARPDILSRIMENSYVKENYLQIWQYNPSIILCLISAPNVQQLIQVTKELNSDLRGVDLMTEIKHYGYFFREASISLVTNSSQ